jgi:protein CpxP
MEATVRRKLIAVLVFAGAATLSAQTPAAARRQARQAQVPDSARPNNRANLEQLVRERMAQVTKQRLGATDEQMVKLQASNRKFDDMRRTLVEQERDVGMSLRDEMLRPDSARQGQVAALLDRVIKTQHQRVDIQEQEQKELANFLTPLQRAKYFALEQQIRQRVTQMRQQLQQGRAGRAGQPGNGQAGRGVQPPPPRQ